MAVLDVERWRVSKEFLDLSDEGDLGPGKGVRSATPAGDRIRKPRNGLRARGRYGDGQFGDLPLDCVEPRWISRALFEKPISAPRGALEGGDARRVRGVDRQNEPIEKAPAVAWRPGKTKGPCRASARPAGAIR